MALLGFDGFEGYSTVADMVGKGTVVSKSRDVWSIQTGRNGGKCIRYTPNSFYEGVLVLNIPSLDPDYSSIFGFAIRFGVALGDNSSYLKPILNFGCDTFSYALMFGYDSNTVAFGYLKDGSPVVSDLIPVNINQWYYIEVKYRCHDTLGVCQWRMDEQLVYNFSGDTKTSSTSNPTITNCKFFFGYNTNASGEYSEVDDIYFADTNGATHNDFLGDVRIDAIHPNGAGNYAQFTPSAGNNYECVDEEIVNESDYVSSATDGQKDSYSYANAPTDLDDADIKAVQIMSYAKRTATADTRKITPFIRTGGTDYSQSDVSLSDSFVETKGDIVLLDPSDSNPWTQAKINACEFGMEVGT